MDSRKNNYAPAGLALPAENDDGWVAVSFPLRRTVTNTLGPRFIGAVLNGVKGAINGGGYAQVVQAYRGTDTGMTSSLKVSFDFDQPTDSGLYGAVAKIGRSTVVAALRAIADGSVSVPDADVQLDVVDALQQGDDCYLSPTAFGYIAQVALFGKLRQASVAVNVADATF